MPRKKKESGKTPYKTPRLVSFFEQTNNGRGYCGPGSSDSEACGDGSAPAYCTNGTIHTPPWCSVGNVATTCATGDSGAF